MEHSTAPRVTRPPLADATVPLGYRTGAHPSPLARRPRLAGRRLTCSTLFGLTWQRQTVMVLHDVGSSTSWRQSSAGYYGGFVRLRVGLVAALRPRPWPAALTPTAATPRRTRPERAPHRPDDPGCPLCRAFSGWLGAAVPGPDRPGAAGHAAGLSPRWTTAHPARCTVVSDEGAVWTGAHAWVMCLWATASHRALAERWRSRRGCHSPGRGVPRGRHPQRLRPARAGGGDYPDDCAGSCAPLTQG